MNNMIARSMEPALIPFPQTRARSGQLPFHFYRSFGNTLFSNPIEKLKTQYEFVHPDEISAFLRSYPFLIADLKSVSEIKSQYFGKSPMTLYYINEAGPLESATLASYIKPDMPREKARELFSQFDKEWWQKISKEAKYYLTVDMD